MNDSRGFTGFFACTSPIILTVLMSAIVLYSIQNVLNADMMEAESMREEKDFKLIGNNSTLLILID